MPTTTSYQNPPEWLQSYITDYLDRSQEYAGREYEQSPAQNAGMNPTLSSGVNALTNRAIEGSPVMDNATGYLNNLTSGDYLDRDAARNQNAAIANPYTGMNNPYLSQSIQNAQGDLTSAWNNVQKPAWETTMQRSGSFGNTGVMQSNAMAQDALQRNLGRIGTDMRMGAYGLSANLAENRANRQFTSGENLAGRQDAISNYERGLQNSGLNYAIPFANQDYTDANNLLRAGQINQGFADQNAQQNYNWWQEAQNYPRQGLDMLGNAINVAGGGSGVTTNSTPGVSRTNSTIGGALGGYTLGNAFGYGGLGAILGGLGGYFG